MTIKKNSIKITEESDNIVVGKVIHSGKKEEVIQKIKERHPEYNGEISVKNVHDNLYEYYYYKV